MKGNHIQPHVNSFSLSFPLSLSFPPPSPTLSEHSNGQKWTDSMELIESETSISATGDSVWFRLSPAQAKCRNPTDLPSEWWICVPLRKLIQSGLLSRRLQPEPSGPQTLPSAGRHSPFVLWEATITASGPAQGSIGNGETGAAWGALHRPLLFSFRPPSSDAGLHCLCQDSPWKPK